MNQSYQYIIVILSFLVSSQVVRSSPLSDECTVTSYDAVATAVKKCTNLVIDGISVPGGKTLDLNLKEGTTLTLKGTITFEYHEWAGPLVTIIGKKVNVDGSGAVLNGQGERYWDGKGASGVKKPKFLKLKTSDGSTLNHIKLLNCPVHCISINSARNTILNDFTIDVSAGDVGALGANTDGFDISSSSDITVQNSVVKNQDDCVAVNQGSNYLFHNLTCSGGHGLSLSVGQSSADGNPNTVKNVTFSDCTVMNSRNGIHVKTHMDAGTGAISDVTYERIKLTGITYYGINVQEDYKDGQSTGYPVGNIPITNLVLKSVTGSMSGGSSSMPVYILCGDGGCNSWPWSDISITNGKQANECNFEPSGYNC